MDRDDIRDKLYFGVAINDKRREIEYTLFSARNNYKDEFNTDNRKVLIEYINNLGTELEESFKQITKIEM